MDSQIGFDEHEDFFESYEAEQARSLAPLELDVENRAPSAEQLARSARFRKPVALFVSVMALFAAASLVSLKVHIAQPGLVARYSAALPATAPTTVASAASPAAAVPSVEPSVDAPSAVVPELTVNASDPEPDDSAPESASGGSAAASARSAAAAPSPVAASVSSPKHSGSAGRVADARGLPARLMSSVPPSVAASAVPTPKPEVAAPSSFNSVARFPDVRH